jgi:hypothetical protein
VIQTVTQTGGGKGCSGTITVEVVPMSNIAVGMDVWASDSMLDYIIPGSTLMGIVNHSGNVTYNHAHPTGTGIGVQSKGNVVFNDTEIDTNYKWGFDFLSGTNSAKVEGTNTFGNAAPLNMFHMASDATVQFGPQTNLCVAATPADYHEFLMPYGTFEAKGFLPRGSSVAPNDTVCSNLGSIFQQPVTLPAIAPATSVNRTSSSNPLTLSSSAWIDFTPTEHKWILQATENKDGMHHYLSMNSPDPPHSEINLGAAVKAPGFFPQSVTAGPYSIFFDDFYSGANMTGRPIGSATTDTCVTSNLYTDINHPGNILITAGTAGAGTGIVCGLISENPSLTRANTSSGWTWETAVYVPFLPGTRAGSYQTGMAHAPNVNPWTTGIGFYLSSANAITNNWYCRYSSTSIDSHVAATVAWTRLTMVDDGALIHWYIGGTEVCGTGIPIARLPSTTQYPAVWSATTLSGTNVSMAYDYINWQRVVIR